MSAKILKCCVIVYLVLVSNGLCEPSPLKFTQMGLYVRLLSEQLSGDNADYENASPEWKLIIEARIMNIMFNYWICVEKFAYDRNAKIEMRFGELVSTIKNNHAYDRTFKFPYYIESASKYTKEGFVSDDGRRFEITTKEQWDAENQKFLLFVDNCFNQFEEKIHKIK